MKQDFQALPTTRKGTIGEAIAKGIIERSGWIVYEPTADAPHLVDFICIKPGNGMIAVDVKTYPRRYRYNDTGIDKADYLAYQNFQRQQSMSVYLVFVDEIERAVYGNWLSVLARCAELDGTKVYFPLSALRLRRYLSREELEQLRAVSSVDRSQYAGERFFAGKGHTGGLSNR